MLSKKSIFFLLATFFGASYSAESPVEQIFVIELVTNPALWRQVFSEESPESRVLVVLHWPNVDADSDIDWLNGNMSVLMQRIKGNERVLDVYFWERIPSSFEEDLDRQVFVAADLKAYFYPSSSKLVIFPQVSVFYNTRGGGVTVAESDYSNYVSLSSLINQVLISILRQRFIYKKIIYLGEKGLLKYLKKDAIHRALDDIYKQADSPIQEFTSRVLGSPPRPIASRGSSPSSSPERERSEGLSLKERPLDSLGNSFRLGRIQSRLKLLQLQEAGLPCRAFPGISTSTDG